MSAVYLVGDTHFGHKGVTRFRPEFSSDEEHNDIILDNILSNTSKRDVLWMMGDNAFSLSAIEKYIRPIYDYVGHLYIVLGNHDYDRDCSIWAEVSDKVYGITKRNKIWFSHAPMHSCELYGKPNIHGHMHRNSVGSDWYRCVSMEQIDWKPIKLQTIIQEFREKGVMK